MIKISILGLTIAGALVLSSIAHGRVVLVDQQCDGDGVCNGIFDIYVGEMMANSSLGLYGRWYSWQNGSPYDGEDWSARVAVQAINPKGPTPLVYSNEPPGPFPEAFTVHNMIYNSNGWLKGTPVTMNAHRRIVYDLPMHEPACRLTFILWAMHQNRLRDRHGEITAPCYVPAPVSCNVDAGNKPLDLNHGAVAVGGGIRPRPVATNAFVSCNRATSVLVRVLGAPGGRIATSIPGVSSIISINGNPGQGTFYNTGNGTRTTIPITSTLDMNWQTPPSGAFTGSGVIQVDIL